MVQFANFRDRFRYSGSNDSTAQGGTTVAPRTGTGESGSNDPDAYKSVSAQGVLSNSGASRADQMFVGRQFGGLPGRSMADSMRHRVEAGQAAGLLEAGRLAGVENARFQQNSQMLGGLFEETRGPSITDADYDMQFGQRADQAALDTSEMLRNLRNRFGQSGLRGGTLAGMGAKVELERLGQLTGAKRDLSIARAQTRSEDRLRDWNKGMELASFRNQSPSMLEMDQINANTGVNLGLFGSDREDDAANAVRRDAKGAGILNSITSIGGGLLSGVL